MLWQLGLDRSEQDQLWGVLHPCNKSIGKVKENAMFGGVASGTNCAYPWPRLNDWQGVECTAPAEFPIRCLGAIQ